MKVLLHICCANCAIIPVRDLRSEGHQLTGFFFNPNIHPYQEYRRRLGTVKEYAPQVMLDVVYHDEYALEDFLEAVAEHPQQRCTHCYAVRLEAAARHAAAAGFDAFTSSLLYSRYQQHEAIRSLGEEIAERHGLTFLYHDFRNGWKEGIAISQAMELYRQQYCGCIYSEKERFCPSARGSKGQ